MSKDTDKIPKIRVGQIWREKDTKRLIKILQECVHDTGPQWTYCKEDGTPEPESRRYSTWFEHYCDLLDFMVWNRFEYVRG